jgi:DNA-binding IscR family transcriptional regulator
VSSKEWTAWELTRRISPREHVGMMKRDAYGRLDENSYPRMHRVSPLEPTAPWLVRLADDTGTFRLLCFDFDGKEAGVVSPDLMEQAADDCDALSGVLDRLAIAHVVCQSSGTGGRHIWVSLHGSPSETVAALARAARANYTTLDHGMLLNARTGGARPPLSPHRDGSASTVLRGSVDALISPSTSTSDVEAVTAFLDASRPAVRRADSQPSGPVDIRYSSHRPLSKTGQSHMATVDGGSNPSWTGFMCLLAAASAGWSLADVTREARTAPGMEHYRTKNTSRGTRKPRSAAEAAARLERQWAKAQQYSALQAPLTARSEPADLSELTAIIDATDAILTRFRVSPGRWGRTESAVHQRTILSAITYLSLQTGKRIVAASIRDLALMTGLGRTTAADALTVLADAGYLKRSTKSDGGNAAEWQLTTEFSTTPGTVRSQPLNNPRPPTELFNLRAEYVTTLERQLTDGRHDLFTRSGLGHLAGQLYALLAQHPALTIDSAARLLGVSLRHTTTILSRLRHHRLIVKHTQGWTRAKRDLRDQAARTLGIAGLLLDRANRYRLEREIWAWWQAEVEHMTTAPQRRIRRPHVSSRTLQLVDDRPGERQWPRYPRNAEGRGDHKEAHHWASSGMLAPGSLWWSSVA